MEHPIQHDEWYTRQKPCNIYILNVQHRSRKSWSQTPNDLLHHLVCTLLTWQLTDRPRMSRIFQVFHYITTTKNRPPLDRGPGPGRDQANYYDQQHSTMDQRDTETSKLLENYVRRNKACGRMSCHLQPNTVLSHT